MTVILNLVQVILTLLESIFCIFLPMADIDFYGTTLYRGLITWMETFIALE